MRRRGGLTALLLAAAACSPRTSSDAARGWQRGRNLPDVAAAAARSSRPRFVAACRRPDTGAIAMLVFADDIGDYYEVSGVDLLVRVRVEAAAGFAARTPPGEAPLASASLEVLRHLVGQRFEAEAGAELADVLDRRSPPPSCAVNGWRPRPPGADAASAAPLR